MHAGSFDGGNAMLRWRRRQISSQSSWIGGKEIDGFFRLARREEAA